MPYIVRIAQRIDAIVSKWFQTDQRKMFGGVCYLLNGHMVCGVYKDYLVLRLGVEKAAKALEKSHVKPFDITGRPMKGWIMVEEKGLKEDQVLIEWLESARQFVETLSVK